MDSSLISREMDVALFSLWQYMYWRHIRLAKRSKFFGSSRLMLFSVVTGVDKGE